VSGKRKGRRAQATKKQSSGGWRPPGWIWLLVGIGLGAYGTVMLFLESGAPMPDIELPRAILSSPEPAAEPETPALPPRTEPKFDFYSILPKQEVVIPQEDIHSTDDRSTGTGPPPSWIVQVGSFRSFQDADGVRAQLALRGIESHISAREGETSTWHRVRVGPIKSRREADRLRSKLQRLNFQPMILKSE